MKIDHIGYAVKNIEKSKNSFEQLGFRFESVIDDEDRNIRLLFGSNDSYRIELVQPLDKSKNSPVDTYLSKMGPEPYHICYKVNDLDYQIAVLEAKRYKVITPPASAVAFAGHRVVFMMGIATGILEIVETHDE